MGHTRQTTFKNTDVISASEIGQYHYCSMAWYLHKCGYEPISPSLDDGAKKHIELGEAIDYTKSSIKKSRVLALIGYLLLTIVILFVIFEVFL
jgi:hypothetical protein